MKTAEAPHQGFWNRSHHLDRMSLKELWVAYLTYPAIIAYVALALVAIGVWAWQPASLLQTLAAMAVSAMVYPLVWYVLHRWVLHSRWMFKFAPLASTWKRIHYDHHQDPNHLEVLFGAPDLNARAVLSDPLLFPRLEHEEAGVVLAARDPLLGRSVALKVLGAGRAATASQA